MEQRPLTDTETRLARLIREHWGADLDDQPKGFDATLVGDLHADSLNVVELVMGIEDEFRIEVADDEAEPFAGERGQTGGTVADLVKLIDGKLGQ